MYKKFIIFSILTIILLNLSSAEVQDIGTFANDVCIYLPQTCDNCTFINISVSIPPNLTTIYVNQSMTRISYNKWTFFFCNTSQTGDYIYDSVGDLNGIMDVESVSFSVNPTGQELTVGQAILYVIMFTIAFIFLIFCIALGIYLPYNNPRDAVTGYVLAIENLKYLKIFMFAISYLIVMLIAYFGYVVSYAFLNLNILGNILYVAFFIMSLLIIPIFIVGVFVIIANLVRDSKVGDMIHSGFRVK